MSWNWFVRSSFQYFSRSAAGYSARPVKAAEAPAQLAGVVSVAPYADLSAKATAFGLLIGNSTSAHVLSRAAYRSGILPKLAVIDEYAAVASTV